LPVAVQAVKPDGSPFDEIDAMADICGRHRSPCRQCICSDYRLYEGR
jgi:hypothetical protein